MYLAAQHLLGHDCSRTSDFELWNAQHAQHHFHAISELINSQLSSSPLKSCVVIFSRGCLCHYYCYCYCFYCLRLFALKIAQLLMQERNQQNCVIQSASLYWMGGAALVKRHHNKTMYKHCTQYKERREAVKELKRIIARAEGSQTIRRNEENEHECDGVRTHTRKVCGSEKEKTLHKLTYIPIVPMFHLLYSLWMLKLSYY